MEIENYPPEWTRCVWNESQGKASANISKLRSWLRGTLLLNPVLRNERRLNKHNEKNSLFSLPTFAMLKWKCSLGTALRAQGRHCHCWLQHRQRTFSTSELSFLLLTPKRCFGFLRYGRKTNPAPVQHTLPSGPIAKKIQARNEHKRAISARDIKQYQRCHMAVTHKHLPQPLEPLWMLPWMEHLQRSLWEGRTGSFAAPELRRIWGIYDNKWLQLSSPPLSKLYFSSSL